MGKLVRDLIPQIAEKSGSSNQFGLIESDEHYRKALLDKLVEEAIEVRESNGDAEEIADVLEVLDAILIEFDLRMSDIAFLQAGKRQERGGFSEGRYML